MKTSIKTTTAILFLCLSSYAGIAQQQGGNDAQRRQRLARVEAAHIAFLTKRLDLTPQQAVKFWPVYNQYQDEVKQMRKQLRNNNGQQPNTTDNLSDAQARQQLDADLDRQQQMIDLRRRYNDLYLRVISASQVTGLYEADRDFRKLMLERVQNRRNGGNIDGKGGRGRNMQRS